MSTRGVLKGEPQRRNWVGTQHCSWVSSSIGLMRKVEHHLTKQENTSVSKSKKKGNRAECSNDHSTRSYRENFWTHTWQKYSWNRWNNRNQVGFVKNYRIWRNSIRHLTVCYTNIRYALQQDLVRWVKLLYYNPKSKVRSAAVVSKSLRLSVDVHEGITLPLFFSVFVMYSITRGVQSLESCTLLYADEHPYNLP